VRHLKGENYPHRGSRWRARENARAEREMKRKWESVWNSVMVGLA
jgi:hypothetical protein